MFISCNSYSVINAGNKINLILKSPVNRLDILANSARISGL